MMTSGILQETLSLAQQNIDPAVNLRGTSGHILNFCWRACTV